MQKKFYLNEGRRTLHKIGGCCHSKYILSNAKLFSTEDEAIASETRYKSHKIKIFFSIFIIVVYLYYQY